MRFTKFIVLTIAIAIMAVFTEKEAYAQPAPERYTKQATDTSIDADTVIVSMNELSSDVTSLTTTVTRVSGAATGTVILQGRNLLNGTWHDIDTLTVTDQVTNEKVYPITSMAFYDYRLLYRSTGTGRRLLRLTYIRRPEDR